MSKVLVGLLNLTKESLCIEWCEIRSASAFAAENVIGRLSLTPAEKTNKQNKLTTAEELEYLSLSSFWTKYRQSMTNVSDCPTVRDSTIVCAHQYTIARRKALARSLTKIAEDLNVYERSGECCTFSAATISSHWDIWKPNCLVVHLLFFYIFEIASSQFGCAR